MRLARPVGRVIEKKYAGMMQAKRSPWQTFEEMKRAAEDGNADAQCTMGICYQTGQGVTQDYAGAVKWFRRAADQNDSTAQCYLGFCYQNGMGVPQDFGQAAKWFRDAAEQGDPAAQFNLGVLYET
ncbi:MAG: tetratricopeptide repeat protein, partial [Limisphaerales bacterium]